MRKTIAPKLIIALSLAMSSLIASAPAQAQSKKQFCKTYARVAVKQYKQSIRLECNFHSPYFHPARALHRLWCMGQPRDVANDGNMRRAEMLSLCEAQGER